MLNEQQIAKLKELGFKKITTNNPDDDVMFSKSYELSENKLFAIKLIIFCGHVLSNNYRYSEQAQSDLLELAKVGIK